MKNPIRTSLAHALTDLQSVALIAARQFAIPLLFLGAGLLLVQPCAATPFQWEFTVSLNTARAGHTAALLADGKVLVVRGQDSSAAVATPILGNYPDTTLALSTDTRVTPDAAPTNTTSINVSTSIDFKGTLAGDPTTGVVRVTDAHPAGTYTVTVTAFDSGGETATKTFALTVTTPVTCNAVSFADATNFGPGKPFSVAVGDFNGDGKQDLAVADPINDNVSILLGHGAGNFSGPTNFTVGSNTPLSVAVGDFNGDGKQDLAVANEKSRNVSILLGDGAGNFSAPTNFTAGDFSVSVAVGDFNGDGKQDLAVANENSGNVSILLGDGAGTFSAPTNFSAGSGPLSVAVGDFNGDGKQDLAVANVFSGNVSILLGDGTGNFSAPTNFTAGAQSVAVGDFNGDGKQDLAVANGNVSILLGDGTGNFSAPTNFTAGDFAVSVAVGDFNGDGKQDLAVANYGHGVSILLGDGIGNFSAPTIFPAGAQSVAVGDFNGDGKQDLAVANYGYLYVSILLGDCPVVPTKVQGLGSIDNQGNEVTFNFRAAQADESGRLGYFYFCDPIAAVCITNAGVRSLSITGNSANFSGYGHLEDGTEAKFKVSVIDNGSPGTSDTISITLDNGYSVGGTLISGDIRIY